MEKINAFFANFRSQAGTFWSTLNTPKKVGFGIAVAAVLGLIVALFFSQGQANYTYLYADIPQDDLHDITAELNKMGYKKSCYVKISSLRNLPNEKKPGKLHPAYW